MCTVSHLPLPGEGFIITSTRDEKTIRKPALPPEKYTIHGQEIYFPRDTDAGGSWIASSPGGHTLCLLNGGFVVHEPRPPYRKSRGLVLLDFFLYNDVTGFRDSYDFNGIEPFTMLVRFYPGTASDGADQTFDELRWDGDTLHHTALNPETPAIWSSVTLYTSEVIRQRNKWFEKWLKEKPEFAIGSIVNFHKTAGTGNIHNDILMNRDDVVKTVSITSLIRSPHHHEFYYEDVVENRQLSKCLPSS